MKIVKLLLGVILLTPFCFAQALPSGGFGPPYIPYVSLIQSATTDAICALHGDGSLGFTCDNAATDGTTETAFNGAVTIPAKALSNNIVQLDSTFLLKTLLTPTSFVLTLRLGGLTGTPIFQSNLISPTTAITTALNLRCEIVTDATASVSTPLAVSCVNQNTNGNIRNTIVPPVLVDVTTVKALVWTVTWTTNASGNAVGLYSMFNGIR